MIFVSASSTPSTTARHSDSENPSLSASCPSAPRTTQRVSGLLRNSIFKSKLRRSTRTFSSDSGSFWCREIVMSQFRRFFCEIVGGPEVRSEERHLAVQVMLQERLAVLVHKLAVNVDRRLARDRGHIALHLAALLEAPYRAVKHHQVRRGSG